MNQAPKRLTIIPLSSQIRLTPLPPDLALLYSLTTVVKFRRKWGKKKTFAKIKRKQKPWKYFSWLEIQPNSTSQLESKISKMAKKSTKKQKMVRMRNKKVAGFKVIKISTGSGCCKVVAKWWQSGSKVVERTPQNQGVAGSSLCFFLRFLSSLVRL